MSKIARPLFLVAVSGWIVLHSPASCAEWVEWLADARVSGQFDSNINRSFSPARQEGDYLGKALLAAGRAYQLGAYTRAYATAEWTGQTHAQFTGLDQVTAGGKGVLTHKFGLGRDVPILRLEFAGADISSNSTLRSGNQLNAGARLLAWHAYALNYFIGYRFDQQDSPAADHRIHGKDNQVFDKAGHTLEIGIASAVGADLQVSVGYQHRWGDIVSNNLAADVSADELQRVASVAHDDALGGWTYRAPGETDSYTVGINYPLFSGHAAVAVDYAYHDTQALGMAYDSHQIQFSLAYSY